MELECYSNEDFLPEKIKIYDWEHKKIDESVFSFFGDSETAESKKINKTFSREFALSDDLGPQYIRFVATIIPKLLETRQVILKIKEKTLQVHLDKSLVPWKEQTPRDAKIV